jgi:hypothetical protein
MRLGNLNIPLSVRQRFSVLSLNPTLWLDSADVATLFTDAARTIPVTADGDSVGAWSDKSASGLHFTQSGTARPTYKTGIRNGKPVIRFDGVNDTLARVNDTGFPTGAMTVLAATKCATSSFGMNQYGGVVNWGTAGTGQTVWVLFGTDGNIGTDGFGLTQYGDAVGTAGQLGTWKSFGICRSGTTYQVCINNVATATKTMTSNTILGGTAVIGGYNGGSSFYLNGDIAELIIVPRACTAAEMAALQAYLSAKWAL